MTRTATHVVVAICASMLCDRTVRAEDCDASVYWQQLHPAPRPAPDARFGHGLVYDAGRERVVLFGGAFITTVGTPDPIRDEWSADPRNATDLDDVWEYDVVNDRWSGPLRPEARPEGRYMHAMAYDSVGRVVLHGGRSIRNGVLHADTWEWQGPDAVAAGQWVRTHPVGEELLVPRWGHAMAFDPSRGKIVLVGGTAWKGTADAPPDGPAPIEYSDVWEYGLGPLGELAWDRIQAQTAEPIGRWGHALASVPSCVPGGGSCIALSGGSAQGNPLSDLWLWDGVGASWTQLQPAGGVGPRARMGHSIYFDAGRQRLVLFGGTGGQNGAAWWDPADTLNDTWELDPTRGAWSETTPFQGEHSRPRRRMFGRMVWDAHRARGALFGGLDAANHREATGHLQDTWHYRFPAWTSNDVRPARRVNSAIAFYGSDGRLLLFGGEADAIVQGDTWVWDGRSSERNWTEYGVSRRTPRARWDHAMTLDPIRERVVLFGGQDREDEVLGDAWEWDGPAFEWTPIPASGVPSRKGHAMAWDPLMQSVLLFGGKSEREVLADTWHWNGAMRRWQLVEAREANPRARIRHGLATDVDRGRVVMFGGMGAAGELFGDTWEWDGGEGRWLQRTPLGERPAPRRSHAMTYDPVQGGIVLFGGYGGDLLGDLWAWNGAHAIWTQWLAPSGPPPVMDAVIAFDPSLGSSVLFGGRGEADREDTTRTFSIPANDRPVLEPVGPRLVHTGELLAIDLVAGDGEPITYSLSDRPEGAEVNAITGELRWRPRDDQAGRHAITVSASDGCATDSERVEITVCRGSCPPTLERIGQRKIVVGIPFALQLIASDPERDPLSFSSSPLPAGAVLDAASGLFAWEAPAEQIGVHAIRFAVSDGYASDAEVVVFTVCDGNCPPVLDPIGDQAVPAGSLLDIAVTASDLDDDPLAVDAPDLPTGASFDALQQRLRWTPEVSQTGVHPVVIRVSDGALSDEETFRVFVCDGNCPPVLAPIADHTVAEGELLSFAVAAQDANGDTVGYWADSLPPRAEFRSDAARFTWVPSFDQGGTSYTVTFWASDGRAETSKTARIQVLDVNRPPVVASLGPLQAVVGEALTVDVPAEDPDGYPVVAEPLERLPGGAGFEGLRFGWTPGQAQIGRHEIRFRIVERGSDRLFAEGRLAVEVVRAVESEGESSQRDGTQSGCGCAAASAAPLGGPAWLWAIARRRRRSGAGS